MAPPALFSVQEVPADTERVATPVRARVMGGGGWFAGCLVGGRWGEGEDPQARLSSNRISSRGLKWEMLHFRK